MKATLWLCSIVTTMLCTTTQSIYASPTKQYKLCCQDNVYLTELMLKRTKPSLSIVNPLDVLRQRLLLEIARRQMRENSRQVEKNREILKNVGKRGMAEENALTEEDYYEFEPASSSGEWLEGLNQVPMLQHPVLNFPQSNIPSGSSRFLSNNVLREIIMNSEFPPHHHPAVQSRLQRQQHEDLHPEDLESNAEELNNRRSNDVDKEQEQEDEHSNNRLNTLHSSHKARFLNN